MEVEVDGGVPIACGVLEVKRSRRAAAEIPLASAKSTGRRLTELPLEKRDGEGESGRRATTMGRMERDLGRGRQKVRK